MTAIGAAEPSAARKAGDKREAILAAALALFVERGFHGTAVPELAERAGVGAGTIYRYFASKEALVNELYRIQKLRFGQIATDDFPATAPTREQFRVLWMRMVRFAIEDPQAIVFLELHHHGPYLDPTSHAIEEGVLAPAYAFLLWASQVAQSQKWNEGDALSRLAALLTKWFFWRNLTDMPPTRELDPMFMELVSHLLTQIRSGEITALEIGRAHV